MKSNESGLSKYTGKKNIVGWNSFSHPSGAGIEVVLGGKLTFYVAFEVLAAFQQLEKCFFPQRVINLWNPLPWDAVMVSGLNAFKRESMEETSGTG